MTFAELRAHTKGAIDGYNELPPSEKIKRGTPLALAIGLLERFMAMTGGGATAPSRDVLVVVNWEDQIVRVFENTDATRTALKEWKWHDADYIAGSIPEADSTHR